MEGTVISYDARRATAILQTEEGHLYPLFGGAFFSGLPARLPEVADRVRFEIQGGVATIGRLIRED